MVWSGIHWEARTDLSFFIKMVKQLQLGMLEEILFRDTDTSCPNYPRDSFNTHI